MSEKFNIKKCPRCGKPHNDLEFKPLSKITPNGYTHYAFCPKTNEPILISVIDCEHTDKVLYGYSDLKYLGDSVYALYNKVNVALVTMEDNEIFDIIYFEPKVRENLIKYIGEIK
jgi:hypothetical protein